MSQTIKVAVGMVRREVGATDFSTLAGPDAAGLVELFGELKKLAESGLTLAAARVEAADRSGLAGTNFKDTKDLLSSAAGISRGAAENLLDLAERLGNHQSTRDAFAEGLLSAAEAAEVARAADRNAAAEESLLNTAKDKKKSFKDLRDQAAGVNDPDPDADARRAAYARARRNVRTWSDSEGLAHLHAQGPPEAMAGIWARIQAGADAAFKAGAGAGQRVDSRHNLFDAFSDVVLSGGGAGSTPRPGAGGAGAGGAGGADGAGGSDGSCRAGAGASAPDVPGAGAGDPPGDRPSRPGGGRPKVDLMILVDWEALRRGVARPGERCDIPGFGPVAVETARSYLGEAALKFILTDGVAVASVAHMGRRRGAHLRSALAAMFQCCVDCGRGLGLEWDHVEPNAKGGPTSFENLRPRCKACHRAKTARDFPEGTSGYRRKQEAIAKRPGTARSGAARSGPSGPGQTRGGSAAGVASRAGAGQTSRRRT